MPSTRAQSVVAVGLAVNPVGKPDAGNPPVRFDERGRETGRRHRARPRLYNALTVVSGQPAGGRRIATFGCPQKD